MQILSEDNHIEWLSQRHHHYCDPWSPLSAAYLQRVGPVACGVVGHAQGGDGMAGVHLCFRDQPAPRVQHWGGFSYSRTHLRYENKAWRCSYYRENTTPSPYQLPVDTHLLVMERGSSGGTHPDGAWFIRGHAPWWRVFHQGARMGVMTTFEPLDNLT